MKSRGFGEIFATAWAMMTGGWFLLSFLLLPLAHAQLPLPFQAKEVTPENFPQTQNNPLLLSSRPLTLVGVDSGANDGSSTLLAIAPVTGSATVIGETGFEVTDVAFTPDGRLFGITFDRLLLIDVATGKASPVGSGLGICCANALAADSKGNLYGATSDNGRFVNIDPQTGIATVIGSFGSGLVSSGDLAFAPDGTLFGVAAGATSDLLIKVNTATGKATMVGPIQFQHVFGIAFDGKGALFGAARGDRGEIPTLIVIDTQTGSGRAIGTITNANGLFGLTYAPAFFSLVCDIQLNKTTFVNGDTVTAQVLRITNTGTTAVAIEFKLWFDVPTLPPVSFAGGGANGETVLPAGFDQNFGPLTLVVVQPTFPRGTYGFNCRFLDPVTGKTFVEDLNPFTIQ